MLRANVARLRAEEVLRERGASLGPEQLRHFVEQATGDRALADKEAAKRFLRDARGTG